MLPGTTITFFSFQVSDILNGTVRFNKELHAAFKIRLGEIHFLGPFFGNAHRGKDQIDFAALQIRNSVRAGNGNKFDLVGILQQILSQRFGHFDLESHIIAFFINITERIIVRFYPYNKLPFALYALQRTIALRHFQSVLIIAGR